MAWLRAHPLPPFEDGTDKNERGRVLAVGGGALVPGALRLTAEAALRAGAGKVQMATIASAALALGVAMPEAAVIALPQAPDGEIDGKAAGPIVAEALDGCDAVVIGPGMSGKNGCGALLAQALDALGPDAAAVLDAAAILACRDGAEVVRACRGTVVLTPHAGEMAGLTGREADWIAANPEAAAGPVAADLGVTIVLKGGATVICSPDGKVLLYPGGGPALATGGSGDVLAGILAGLLARGADPLTAAAWSVWAHGEAGRACTNDLGGPGLLARELAVYVPRFLTQTA